MAMMLWTDVNIRISEKHEETHRCGHQSKKYRLHFSVKLKHNLEKMSLSVIILT